MVGFDPVGYTGDAVVEVYRDGALIFRDTDWRATSNGLNGGTLYPGYRGYLKFGIYKAPGGPATEAWFANMRVTTTRDEALGPIAPPDPEPTPTPPPDPGC